MVTPTTQHWRLRIWVLHPVTKLSWISWHQGFEVGGTSSKLFGCKGAKPGVFSWWKFLNLYGTLKLGSQSPLWNMGCLEDKKSPWNYHRVSTWTWDAWNWNTNSFPFGGDFGLFSGAFMAVSFRDFPCFPTAKMLVLSEGTIQLNERGSSDGRNKCRKVKFWWRRV